MIIMKILSVLTPLYIYHGCYTWKTLWVDKFTGGEKFTLGEFSTVNMENCDHHNVRKYKKIKSSDKYATLDISLTNDRLDKIICTFSESKVKLGRSGKGLINFLSLKAKTRSKKYEKATYAIRNISKKDPLNIIRKFEKLPYKSYEKKRPKHKTTES